MDNNNFNQNNSFGASQQPNYGQTYGSPQQPNFGQPQPYFGQPAPQVGSQEVEEIVNSAFGKNLAAVIMAWFPIANIIAIIFASMGLKLVRSAIERGNQLGVEPSGKNIAAKVLGTIGLIASIVTTAVYTLYFFIVIVFAAEFSSAISSIY